MIRKGEQRQNEDFPEGAANSKMGRCQPISRPNFPEKCMKIKKIAQRGGYVHTTQVTHFSSHFMI